ncbi:hypothetical protein GPECTOR_4g533 [Gonium pectorale]|uniref:Steroid 5-alpha reductase C-terminal domain-containing protein n=1 Tax=Gonium pectorale TaxID=33097 RepID=A0A150GXQ7_GONPE|nr:hypothetical protein GPECTOR_4g533 [Gonium pectorale]|eukprot:KXZ54468.1 hypothetical protein GPECTOR_4g533 [Gonium pectorale]
MWTARGELDLPLAWRDDARSILPPIYVAIFAREDLAAAAAALQRVLFASGAGSSSMVERLTALARALAGSGADTRLLLAVLLSGAWGCRLTFNFWRKGGYNLRYEDYRWLEVRKLMSPLLFELFNLVFVAAAQHLLCLLITLPAFVAYAVRRDGPQGATAPQPPPPLGGADWAAVALFCALLAGEAIADEQQWTFQRRKRELIQAKQPLWGDYRRGFRTTGLFRFSRHPNFFCEYGMWWAIYLLCAALPCGCLLGWSAAGAAGLTLLFHGGSLWITERISACRYPDYVAYRDTTSAIVPGRPGPRLPDRDV